MEITARFKRWLLDDLYREPRGGKGPLLAMAFGVAVVAFGVVGILVASVGAGLQYVLLGLAVGAMGAAELVPPDRIELARNLRVGSMVAFVLYAGWVFGPLFLAAGLRTKLVVVASLLLLVGYGWFVWKIFRN